MRDFLKHLWIHPEYPVYNLYGELRIIHNGMVDEKFYELGVTGTDTIWNDAIFADQAGKDVYFGVAPRRREQGTADACVRETHVLWADVDSKHFDGSKAAALFSLGRAQLTPSILVDSGNGFHAYWFLKGDFVPFEYASKAMQGLAKAIGGDAVHDASRILRLPGTHNHKTDPPNPVRILHFEPDRRYAFTDFDAYMPEERPAARPVLLEEPIPWEQLPEWLATLIKDGAPKGTRSEQAFKACVWLLRFGWHEDQIRILFEAYGIGEKFREQGKGGERWLERTLKSAREAV